MQVRSRSDDELRVLLNLTLTSGLFWTLNDRLAMPQLFSFFVLDDRNPSSIFCCWESAWNNAHAVRGSLSSEIWESINSSRIELHKLRRKGINSSGEDAFFDRAKEWSHLFRGAMFGTLMRGDAMSFIRLGTLLERADCTARLLDVTRYLSEQDDDSVREYYRLDTLLHMVSACEACHTIYRQQLASDSVNDMLILREESPRPGGEQDDGPLMSAENVPVSQGWLFP